MFKRIILPNLANTLAWLLAWIAIAVALLFVAGSISSAGAETFALKAGSLAVKVDTGRTDRKLTRGDKVNVKFRIRTSTSDVDAEIKLDFSGFKFVEVSGKDTDSYSDNRRRIIEVNGLQADETREVTVVFRIGSGQSVLADRALVATLGIKIVDTESDDTARGKARWALDMKAVGGRLASKVPWRCAGKYSKALKLISDGDGKAMTTARKILRKTDALFPGYWYFATDGDNKERRANHLDDSQRKKRYCLRAAQGDGAQRCLKSTTSRFAGLSPARATKDERKLFSFLTEFMERRGYAPEFGNNGRYRWLIPRVSMDLNRYVAQPAHVALCTGVPEYLRFHKRNLRPFVRRAKKVAKTLKSSSDLSRVRFLQALKAATEEAQDRTAMGERIRSDAEAGSKAEQLAGQNAVPTPKKTSTSAQPPAPLYPPKVTLPAVIREVAAKSVPAELPTAAKQRAIPQTYVGMINALAPLVLPPDRLPALKAETVALSALKFMEAELATRPVKDRPRDSKTNTIQPGAVAGKKTLRAVLAALRTIEAGVYAQQLSTRYINVQGAISNTLTGIAAAHKEHCGCNK